MASIHEETLIETAAANVWDAIRDVGAIHERLAPGFVVDTRLEGDAVPAPSVLQRGVGVRGQRLSMGVMSQ